MPHWSRSLCWVVLLSQTCAAASRGDAPARCLAAPGFSPLAGACTRHEWPFLLIIEAVFRSSFHRCQKMSLVLNTARYLPWKAEGIQAGEAILQSKQHLKEMVGPGWQEQLEALQPDGWCGAGFCLSPRPSVCGVGTACAGSQQPGYLCGEFGKPP